MEPEWVLFSLGFSEDPDPMVATFVVGTAIAEDITEALQARFPKLQHSRRSWGEYSPNERNALVQMVCDARQGALPEPQRALVGSAHEMLERRVEELDRAYHGGILPSRYHAGAVIEMRRLLDAGEPLEAVKGETESSMDCVSNHRKGAIVKPKRSTESGEGRVKLIAVPTDDEEPELEESGKGITLFDLMFVIEEDEITAKKRVKEWVNNGRITATKIGKCPIDGRRQLYVLSELLSDAEKNLSLHPREKSKYSQVLTAKLRPPCSD